MMWRTMMVCAIASGAPLLAQEPQPPDVQRTVVSLDEIMAAADTALAYGDREAAKNGYEIVVANDPSSSRATFRLAQLEDPASARAIELYRRYVVLEPDDAWGWIALAEALTDAGETDEAIDAYASALERAPDERDATIAQARLMIERGRSTAAIAALSAWTARRRDDVEAWGILARLYRAAGDVDREMAALERVAELDPQDPSSERLAALDARTAPAVQPSISASTDSDGSGLTRTGLAGDVALASRVRLGVHLERATASDADGVATVDRGVLYLTSRGDAGFTFDARAGVAIQEDAKGKLLRSLEPVGRVRAKWSGAGDAIGAELRLQRTLQDATVTLIDNGIVLEEALASIELPTGDRMRLRLLGAGGSLVAGNDRNWRLRAAGGPLFEVHPGVRVGVQYDGTMYTERAHKGYFAPALAHTLEATAYGEIEELGELSLAADIGAGVQQIIDDRGSVGTLSPALRGWGSVAWNFRPASSLSLELEGYNVIGGGGVARGASGWSYISAALALRLTL
jgi:tetratricopeptide (TPR) repeat protein